MKNVFKLFGVRPLVCIAIAVVIVCTACDDGSNNGNNETSIKAPSVTQLPDFPAGSQPATIKADAEQVLKELRQTMAIQKLNQEIDDFIEDYRGEKWWDKGYNFTNISIPGANVKVSASGKGEVISTGGFKVRSDLYDSFDWDNGDWDDLDAALAQIQFKVGDKELDNGQSRKKGEVTADKTVDGVIFASGSTFEEIMEERDDVTAVVKAGTIETMRFEGIEGGKWQIVIGYTVTTSSGSIKIVLGMTGEEYYSAKNASWEYDDEEGEWEYIEKCSGSLKIYGKDNTLLINHPINNWSDSRAALEMIGYREVEDDNNYSVRKARVIGSR